MCAINCKNGLDSRVFLRTPRANFYTVGFFFILSDSLFYFQLFNFFYLVVILYFQCSTTCGESERRRQVTCLTDRGEYSENCNERDKPSHIQRCRLQKCPETTTTTAAPSTIAPTTTEPPENACTDSKSWCPSLAIYKYYCMRSYYQRVCCQTCSSGWETVCR